MLTLGKNCKKKWVNKQLCDTHLKRFLIKEKLLLVKYVIFKNCT